MMISLINLNMLTYIYIYTWHVLKMLNGDIIILHNYLSVDLSVILSVIPLNYYLLLFLELVRNLIYN